MNSMRETPGMLALDAAVKESLSTRTKIQELKQRLEDLDNVQKKSVESSNVVWDKLKADIISQLAELKNNEALNMYLSESAELVEEYKKILSRPVRMSFMGPVEVSSTEKNDIFQKYSTIYNKYMHSRNLVSKVSVVPEKEMTCARESCDSTAFRTINETVVCDKCSTVQAASVSTTSYADIDRINVSTRYLYDRKVHFRDCVLQFQGRQNVTIDKSVYDELEIAFDKHHLLVGDDNTPVNIRFSKITKEHILMFLKELKLSKHYENVQLIHFNLTGKTPPDISHLEGVLLSDFEQLTVLYDEMYRDDSRKNFINTQYTLFQLLKRHKYPCEPSEFSIIKTSERRDWHHRVCKNLFSKLNWNFTAV
jgi:hypothetical protein